MKEILSGVMHWTAVHPNLGFDVSSYFLVDDRVLIDPMEPREGMAWFRENGPPEHVLLSNRHHYRDSRKFADAFGCRIHASRPGMHEFADEPVDPFDFGAELPGGVTAYEVGVLCPDETALHIPARGALAVADGVIREPDELGFVGDHHLGDDPEAVKRGLREVYARLAEQLDFDNLLLAHGDPILGGGRDALREFAAG